MARILYLCPRIPYPPTDGSRIRMFNTARLLQREHDVELLIVDVEPSVDAVDRLRETFVAVYPFQLGKAGGLARSLCGLVSPDPLQVSYYSLPSAREWIADRESAYDLVYAYLPRMGRFLTDVTCPRAIDFGDAFSNNYESMARSAGPVRHVVYGLESRRMANYEARLLDEVDAAAITTAQDRKNLGGDSSTKSKVSVVPNGVDQRIFEYELDNATGAPSLAFLGAMDYGPNVEAVVRFCRDVFPAIRSQYPDVSFRIVGKDPVRRVRRLGERDGVVVTGFVDDPYESLVGTDVFVAPLLSGGGIQNKVLEAMGLGLPVVTTPLGATGIDAVAGKHLIVAPSLKEFADTVLALLNDEQRRERLGERARMLVRTTYTWDAVEDRLADVIAAALEPRSSAWGEDDDA